MEDVTGGVAGSFSGTRCNSTGAAELSLSELNGSGVDGMGSGKLAKEADSVAPPYTVFPTRVLAPPPAHYCVGKFATRSGNAPGSL